MIAGEDVVDNKSKVISSCLGLSLYLSLPTGTKEHIKQSILFVKNILTPSDESGVKIPINYNKKNTRCARKVIQPSIVFLGMPYLIPGERMVSQILRNENGTYRLFQGAILRIF